MCRGFLTVAQNFAHGFVEYSDAFAQRSFRDAKRWSDFTAAP